MVTSNEEYLGDVRPVAKIKKKLELMEKNPDRIAYGFEASFEEIADFYQQTYKLGSLKVKMLQAAGNPSKFKIMLLAELEIDEGEKCFEELLVSVTSTSADGAIIKSDSLDFMGNEEDLFHYFGLELRDEKKKILPLVIEGFNS